MGDVDYVLSVRAVSGGAFVSDVGATRFLQVPAGAGVSPDQTIGASAWYNAVQTAAAWTNAQGQPRGDLLFVVANLARKLEVEPEDALRAANAKFIRRFGFIEAELARDGRTPEQSNLAEMDALWDAAKAAEKG